MWSGIFYRCLGANFYFMLTLVLGKQMLGDVPLPVVGCTQEESAAICQRGQLRKGGWGETTFHGLLSSPSLSQPSLKENVWVGLHTFSG